MLKGREKAFKVIRKQANDFARAFMVAVDNEVVTRTPRRYGVAAANWLPSIDAPRTETKFYPYTRKDEVSRTEHTESLPRPKKNNAIYYLCNNLPYIEKLNDGAAQFTQGIGPKWVETGIRIAERKVKRMYK